jgi:hypothetical protein
VFVHNGSSTITNSSITNNTAYLGGGIHLFGGTAHIITGTTVSNNYATASVTNDGLGGGGISIINANPLGVSQETYITNSTISGNISASRYGEGGIAIGGYNEPTLFLKNITVANNIATAGQGGGINAEPVDSYKGIVTISNSLIVNNTSSVNPDVKGALISQGFNLIGNRGNSFGYLNTDLPNGTNPFLGNLSDNGGPTQTHALLSNSPAINAGNSADAPLTDQRGFERIVGGIIDIGAFESDTPASTPTPTPTPTATPTVTPTPTPTPTVTPTPSPTPQNCLFLITPPSQDFPASGGTGTISVSGQTGCSYSSLNESTFVTLDSGATGTGNGTVNFTVAANSGAARSVMIFVAGQNFTVNQAAYVKSRKRVRFF